MDRILTPWHHPFSTLSLFLSLFLQCSFAQFASVSRQEVSRGERRKPESGSGGGGDTELRTCNHPFFPTMLRGCWKMWEPTVVKTLSCSCGSGGNEYLWIYLVTIPVSHSLHNILIFQKCWDKISASTSTKIPVEEESVLYCCCPDRAVRSGQPQTLGVI